MERRDSAGLDPKDDNKRSLRAGHGLAQAPLWALVSSRFLVPSKLAFSGGGLVTVT